MRIEKVWVVAVILAACRSHHEPSANSASLAEKPPALVASSPTDAGPPRKPDAPVFPTAPDAPGPVVIAVQDGGIYLYDKAKLTKLDGAARATGFAQTRRGTVRVLGSFPSWILGADEKLVESPTAAFGDLVVGPNGDLWHLGASNELQHSVEGSDAPPVKENIPAGAGEYVSKIAVDPKGDVYLASLETFYRKQGSEWKTVKASELAKGETQIQGLVPVGPDVYAIIGTAGYTIDGKKLSLPPTVAMFAVYVQGAVSASAAGVTSFHTGLEYVVVTPDGKSRIKRVEALGVKGASVSRGIAVDGQGRRWLGTDGGLVVLSKDDKVLQVWPTGTLPGAAENIFVVGAGPELGTEPPPVVHGGVKGKVVIDGEPLRSSEVLICDTPASVMTGANPCSGKAVVVSSKTDDEGVFHFDDVPAWSYGFAMKTKTGWSVTLGSTLGRCCKDVEPGKELDLGEVGGKTN